VNRIVCHPTLPVTITAHEDRHIRFFDNNSGKTCYVLLYMRAALSCFNAVSVFILHMHVCLHKVCLCGKASRLFHIDVGPLNGCVCVCVCVELPSVL